MVSVAVADERITSFSTHPVSGSDGRRVAGFAASLTAGTAYVVEDSPDLVTWNRVSPILRPIAPTLNWSATHNLPMYGTTTLYPYAGGNWHTRRFYRIRPLAPEDSPPAVPPSPVDKKGRLTEPTRGNFEVVTAGGWTIHMQATTFTLTDPSGKHTWQAWGDGNVHENLNGKHLKDWFSTTRTILIPGDGMITMTSAFNTTLGSNTIKTISIYDADQSHRLDMHLGTVLMSELRTRLGEAAEPDGETCRFWDTGNGSYLENIYTQEAQDNNGQPLPQTHVPLGTTGGPANPTQVNDLIDDPRLLHT